MTQPDAGPTPQTPGDDTPSKRGIARAVFGPFTRENIFAWGSLIVIVLLCHWLLVEPYKIPSGSMEPTLHGDPGFLRGDRVAVNKILYGTRVPFANKRLWQGQSPERWDVVVFYSPEAESPNKILIKRVVGLPGERVHIGEDGIVRINSEPVQPPPELRLDVRYTHGLGLTEDEIISELLMMAETAVLPKILNSAYKSNIQLQSDLDRVHARLAGRKSAELSETERSELAAEFSPVCRDILLEWHGMQMSSARPFTYGIQEDDAHSVIPDGHYFVLGDNSTHSVDSRYYGWVPGDNIIGRMFAIWWPVSRWRDFTGYSRTPWGMAVLYGVPLLFLAYAVVTTFVMELRRVAARPGAPRRWVRVDRRAMGIRLPFTGIRLTRGRYLQPNEWVLYYVPSDQPGGGHARVAPVARRNASGYFLAGPSGGEQEVHTRDIIGPITPAPIDSSSSDQQADTD